VAGLPSGSGLQENVNAFVVLIAGGGSCGVHHDPIPIFTRKVHAHGLAHPEKRPYDYKSSWLTFFIAYSLPPPCGARNAYTYRYGLRTGRGRPQERPEPASQRGDSHKAAK